MHKENEKIEWLVAVAGESGRCVDEQVFGSAELKNVNELTNKRLKKKHAKNKAKHFPENCHDVYTIYTYIDRPNNPPND